MLERIAGQTAVAPVSGADQRRDPPPRSHKPEPAAETAENSPASRAVEKALKSLEPPLMGQNERLSILKDEATGLFVYRSIDKDTGEVVRQWPAESMLQFKAYLRQGGVAFDDLA